MSERRRRWLLAAVIIIGLTGCRSGPAGDRVDADAEPAAPGTLWEGAAPDLAGTLYVLTGPEPYSANLLEVSLPSGPPRQLTRNPQAYGISSFSASRAGIALATAENGWDQLRVIAAGTSALWGDDGASVPSIDQRGRVLAARPSDTGVGIDLYEPGRGRRELLPDDPRDPAAVWGPAGSVLVAAPGERGVAGPTRIEVRDDRGRLVRDAGRPGGYFGLLANPYPDRQPVTGVRPGREHGGFVLAADLATAVEVPRGWQIGCWSPRGTELLVVRGRTVGLWRQARPGEVESIGTSSVPVLACSWVQRPPDRGRTMLR